MAVRNTGKAVRQVLPLWPTTPETKKHGEAPHLLKSRRDKTPLSEGFTANCKVFSSTGPFRGCADYGMGLGLGVKRKCPVWGHLAP